LTTKRTTRKKEKVPEKQKRMNKKGEKWLLMGFPFIVRVVEVDGGRVNRKGTRGAKKWEREKNGVGELVTKIHEGKVEKGKGNPGVKEEKKGANTLGKRAKGSGGPMGGKTFYLDKRGPSVV